MTDRGRCSCGGKAPLINNHTATTCWASRSTSHSSDKEWESKVWDFLTVVCPAQHSDSFAPLFKLIRQLLSESYETGYSEGESSRCADLIAALEDGNTKEWASKIAAEERIKGYDDGRLAAFRDMDTITAEAEKRGEHNALQLSRGRVIELAVEEERKRILAALPLYNGGELEAGETAETRYGRNTVLKEIRGIINLTNTHGRN